MHILKTPFSNGSLGKNIGSKDAPDAIVEELPNFFLTESGFVPKFTQETIEVDQFNIEESHNSILIKVKESLENYQKTLMIGGDHSITYPAVKAFLRKNPEGGLLVFDAHPDCCHNSNPPSHEDYLRTLIQENLLNKSKVILVGLRKMSAREKEFLESNNILYHDMRKISQFGVQEVCDTMTEHVRNWPALYLSLDIDVVDPAFAPGTGYQEPGGLTSREMIYFIQRIRRLKNLKFIDLVEVAPDKDINNATIKLAAKLIVELS